MVSSLESFIQFHRTLSQQLRRIRMSSLPNCLRKYFIERCSGRGAFVDVFITITLSTLLWKRKHVLFARFVSSYTLMFAVQNDAHLRV